MAMNKIRRDDEKSIKRNSLIRGSNPHPRKPRLKVSYFNSNGY
jgi:hypothetical protein